MVGPLFVDGSLDFTNHIGTYLYIAFQARQARARLRKMAHPSEERRARQRLLIIPVNAAEVDLF